jgi:hypothetical protein
MWKNNKKSGMMKKNQRFNKNILTDKLYKRAPAMPTVQLSN